MLLIPYPCSPSFFFVEIKALFLRTGARSHEFNKETVKILLKLFIEKEIFLSVD